MNNDRMVLKDHERAIRTRAGFVKWLKREVEESGLTQAAIGRAVDIPTSSIYNYMKGVNRAPESKIRKFEEFFAAKKRSRPSPVNRMASFFEDEEKQLTAIDIVRDVRESSESAGFFVAPERVMFDWAVNYLAVESSSRSLESSNGERGALSAVRRKLERHARRSDIAMLAKSCSMIGQDNLLSLIHGRVRAVFTLHYLEGLEKHDVCDLLMIDGDAFERLLTDLALVVSKCLAKWLRGKGVKSQRGPQSRLVAGKGAA